METTIIPTTTDSGDRHSGLDCFGRITDHRWINSGADRGTGDSFISATQNSGNSATPATTSSTDNVSNSSFASARQTRFKDNVKSFFFLRILPVLCFVLLLQGCRPSQPDLSYQLALLEAELLDGVRRRDGLLVLEENKKRRKEMKGFTGHETFLASPSYTQTFRLKDANQKEIIKRNFSQILKRRNAMEYQSIARPDAFGETEFFSFSFGTDSKNFFTLNGILFKADADWCLNVSYEYPFYDYY